MKVKFTPNTDRETQYKDLTTDNVYRVISIGDYVRLMSDEGLPYCYPSSLFTIIDEQWPDDWIVNYGENGERYVSPQSLSDPGFFERFFDGDAEARLELRKRLQKWRRGED